MPFPQKFTQGPWRSLPPAAKEGKENTWYSCRVTAASGYHLADVRCGFASAAKQVECAANALLIAAAPKMFALLDKIASEIERDEIPVENRGETYVEICELLNEIAGGDERAAYLRDVSVRVTCHWPEERD